MSVAIRFDSVSKRFTLHRQRPRSFQELVIQFFKRKGGYREPRHGAWDGAQRERHEEFWALRDVSFSVEQGDTVGIIGPNGAGKSTVLKLISRIIEPTSGQICVNGRVGALLELGAGFHPDLSGRENIYLNGSILGLGQREIDQKLDDIVAFAELERFIDIPVKHYSSGMYMRLGFSIAVHIEPRILLVDEVLAVGDAGFQRKCLERIDELHREGVTILFVSHSPDAVRNICSRVLWLDEGKVVADESAESVVARYLDRALSERGCQPGVEAELERRWGSGRIRITEVRLLNGSGQETRDFQPGEPLAVEMSYRAEEKTEHPVFGLAIHRGDGLHISGPNTRSWEEEIPWVEGEGKIRYRVPSLPLLGGAYFVSVAAHSSDDAEMYDYHDRLYAFRVRHASRDCYGIMSLGGKWSWTGTGS